jgi:pyrophosphatase PpaX
VHPLRPAHGRAAHRGDARGARRDRAHVRAAHPVHPPGTLVDTVGLILASVRHAFEGRRCPTDAEWIAGIGQPLRVQLRSFARDEDEVEELLARYRVHQRANHDAGTRCFARAADAVAAVRAEGRQVAVVTAKLVETAERTLRHVGLAPLVDVVVGADSCARHKPDPEPVLLALRRLGRAPSEAVFLGDSPHDVAAGNAAGVVTIGALWGACSREALAAAAPAHLLERIDGLPPMLSRIERSKRSLG